MAIKRKYLVGQKMSDAKVERILLAFAHGATATTFIQWSRQNMKNPPSPKTVFSIYTMVRRRLLEVNMFPDPEFYYKFWSGEEQRELLKFWNNFELIDIFLEPHRTIRPSNFYPIHAEAIFRAENLHEYAERMLRSIKEVVKITGPLNRPPVNLEVWHQWNSIRNDERLLLEARHTGLPRAYFNPEESIQEKLKILRRMLRKGHRLKARPAPRRRPQPARPQSNCGEDHGHGHT